MSASMIAVTNQKGGVGKTTTAAALLSSLHNRGARVLGVDLDPQGSLGFSLGLDIERCATIYDVFRGEMEPQEAISHTDVCDLLPSNILLSGAEMEFNRPGREYLLKTALSKVEENYDYIIVDTPPALNLLTVNAYVAVDSLIIPMAPEVLSLLGVSQIKETIESVREYFNSRLEVLGILLNRYAARFNLNREVLELAGQIAQQLHTVVFEAKIRGSVSVAEAPAHGLSVVDYAPSSKPAQDFEQLCDQVAGARFPRVKKGGKG
ncbi:ParA family protein [uncultured Flavonifractor sp.]|uniref:ParA family protein n=1 Tax=uncultured Flavonifractor sp. TaxID=1193534 RepID=UPI00262D180E|nr:ParA family protein [uncultured Flavonifractor sp.]